MAEEATTPNPEAPEAEEEKAEQHVPYERFKQANTKAKEAAEKAAKLEKDLAALRTQMEERDQAGLPELERERKRVEQMEQRLRDAEKRAEAAEAQTQRTRKENWVRSAAQNLNFHDPGDAVVNVSADDLDSIDSAEDAERVVKRIARAKKHLIKTEGPNPEIGRVLENGREARPDKKQQTPRINPQEEAESLLEGLNRVRNQGWQISAER